MTKKEITHISFKCTVRAIGNSGHILVPHSMVGKEVEVDIQVLS